MKERWRKEGRRERKAKGVERGREYREEAIERERKTKQEKTRMTGRGSGGEGGAEGVFRRDRNPPPHRSYRRRSRVG